MSEIKEMSMFDDEAEKQPRTHQVGMPIDTMSVDELNERIAMLEAEIERLRQAIAVRNNTRQAAESLFRL